MNLGRKIVTRHPQARGSKPHTPPLPHLSVQQIIQHGDIIEVQAEVEPGATVMINGEKAVVIWDGSCINTSPGHSRWACRRFR